MPEQNQSQANIPLDGQVIAFIGAGNMAEAMIRGILAARELPPNHVIGTAPRAERREWLQASYGIQVTEDNADAASKADIVVLAVKPQIIERVLGQIAGVLQSHALVISIAAGVNLATLHSHLAPETHIVRTMPNTPVRVGMGATAIAVGDFATDDDVARVHAIFEPTGIVVEVDESLMDGVTGLSGSGPAYVFMIIEALADAGVKVGLPRYKALQLAAQTVAGSAKLLIDTGDHPGVLKDRVTSPGGTAIAGLHTLEEGGLRTTLINAVEAATKRSRELGAMVDDV